GRAASACAAAPGAAAAAGIRGFLGRPGAPGVQATAIEATLSMRASIQCDIPLDDVALPAEAVLPEVTGLKGPFSCLNEARYGMMSGAMGAARDSFDVALDYAQNRLRFDKPMTAYQ